MNPEFFSEIDYRIESIINARVNSSRNEIGIISQIDFKIDP